MWAAIRSDLSEFVSSVAEETDHVTKAVISDDGEVVSTRFEETGLVQSAEDELLRLMNIEETFSTPLSEGDEAVQKFVDNFDIESKTDEIAKTLEENPETVKIHFEGLVPTQISYELFWQRFFYRCDADRIAKEWDKEAEAQRRTRAEAIKGGIDSVTNMFGGALNAVSQSLEKADQSKEFKIGSVKALSDGGMKLFGNEGRPPFVMNTVVDEDDEEEELGWDDDDDEDGSYEEEEGEENELKTSGKITSGEEEDNDRHNVNEELETVINERDSLQETVELQRKEIVKLRETTSDVNDAKQIESLKITLSEKESELLSLRAKLEDNSHCNIEQIEKDANKFASLDGEMENLKLEISSKDKELEIAKKRIEFFEGELAKTKEDAKKQVDSLTQALASREGNDVAELSAAKEEACTANSKIEELTMKLAKVEKELVDTKTRNSEMESQSLELVATKQKLEQMNLEIQELESAKKLVVSLKQEVEELQEQMQHTQSRRASPSSESTGVKVDAGASIPTEAGDDGWGDDW
mmetsp:Transcript_12157/g.18665  ORF Transcript_12157/g.18665 Transcript_12157/m.18665 type:complete len:526 (-) Transcript_12157:1270-2847(-)|eukprot:CAMPEP_0178924302 /NCGR_PEP_ID=MMETSP0786-20121207/17246_1 /TAXON_ID=186022 /ORGANISM="Thalassionema frauenfeldii, Strain CCMP 1798" /LENGTH=525 /DNA_ID=CAMNT_0020598987 /DNA_START=232 /DNA_END=1809 /DNA_ORIENTATION=-